MSELKTKFQQLLQELFQFDLADLDFGIYRIMNHKRQVIERWINEDLPSAIEQELQKGVLAEQGEAQQALAEARRKVLATLGQAAIDPEGHLDEAYAHTPLGQAYLEAKAKAQHALSSEALEAAIYNHLYAFFSRYYQDGDFISQRRYSKKERYAIPYNGEEVALYWANHDQYYVKTAERFTDYTWKAPKGVTVHFKLQAADVEQNNVKGEKRFFLPVLDALAWDEAIRTLTIPFEYRLLTPQEEKAYGAKNQQEAILEKARQAIPERLQKNAEARTALMAERRKDAKGNPVSYLEHHLRQYTARNTRDFFIHKDLKGFLSRELDFYLKNEVLNPDELEAAGECLSEGWFQLMRLIKRVGNAIIDFLAQIEEFQKTLWEKKKFVTDAFYCITVGNIREEFFDEIAACAAQWDEWRRLGFLENARNAAKVDFLKSNPSLPLDTRHFPQEFTDRLLASFPDLDGMTDGLLIHSDNWQALNLLQEKYRERVKTIYIDPPYNTGNDDFLYRDNYQHSSWLAMMHDRLVLGREWMREDGAIFTSIDDNELQHLTKICNDLWERIGIFVWEKKKKGSHLSPTFRDLTEYVLAYARDVKKVGELYGEKAYSGKWQPLIKRANSERELSFPPGQIQAELKDGTYAATTYGDGEMAVQLLDDITVKGGVVQNAFRMRARFTWRQETVDKELAEGSVIKLSSNMRPNVLRVGQDEKSKRPASLITKDIAAYEDAFDELKDRFGGVRYPYPKPSGLVAFVVRAVTFFNPAGAILDFFAGSGTTGHAVINLNREDGGRRKFILVEMGGYFDTVLLPRIKKVTFSPEWKDGAPKRMATQEEFARGLRLVKVIRLESYEDALNNIAFNETDSQQALTLFGDEYLLRYMLKWEARRSETLLDVEKLQTPFSYQLHLHRDGETRLQPVDLPETFNYLLGLDVETRKVYNDNGRRYLALRGVMRNGRKVVVIWRDTQGWTQADYERDAAFVAEQNLTDGADEIFVNGDSCIPGAQSLDGVFKARLFGQREE